MGGNMMLPLIVFIVLLLRLHLKSIRNNGRLFNFDVCVPSSPRSPPAVNQTYCVMWPAGGGDWGFKTAAPRGPGPETTLEPGPRPAEDTRTADSEKFLSFFFSTLSLMFDFPSSGWIHFFFSPWCLGRYAVCTLPRHLRPHSVGSVQSSCFLSARQRPGAVPESRPGSGAASPPVAAKSSKHRTPVTGERCNNQLEASEKKY